MADTKPTYSGMGTPITIPTLVSLASNAYICSAIVDNQTNRYQNAWVNGSFHTLAAVTVDGSWDVFAVGSGDGNDFHAGLDQASESLITWGSTGNSRVNSADELKWIGSISIDADDDNDEMYFGPFEVSGAFGGILTPKWRIVMLNNTADALHATQTLGHLEYTAHNPNTA